MTRRRLAGAIAVSVSLLAPAAHGWTQLKGGPDRGGLAEFAGVAVDVWDHVAWGPGLHGPRPPWNPGFAWIGPEMVGVLGGSDDGCFLARLAHPFDAPARLTQLDGCREGVLVGFDAVNGAVIVCAEARGDAAVLQAWRLDGTRRWALSPRAFAPPDSLADVWECSGAALDEASSEALVPMASFFRPVAGTNVPRHPSVVAVDLADGVPRWTRTIPAQAFVAPEAHPILGEAGQDATQAPRFIPRAVTVTSTGLLVSGDLLGAAVAWLARDGSFVGATSAYLGGPGEERGDVPELSSRASDQALASGSAWAAAAGDQGALELRGRLWLINPSQPTQPTPYHVEDYVAPSGSMAQSWLASPAWVNGTVYLPQLHGVSAYLPRPTPSLRWTWAGDQDWFVSDVLASAADRVWVLRAQPSPGQSSSAASRTWDLEVVSLESSTGVLVQRMPLRGVAGAPCPTSQCDVQVGSFIPAGPDAVFVLDPTGNLTRLGPARAGANVRLALGEARPDPGEALTLSWTDGSVRGAAEWRVAWGDGAAEVVPAPTTLSHAYADARPYLVSVTAVRADGTTETSVATVDVGGTLAAVGGPASPGLAPPLAALLVAAVAVLLAVSALLGARAVGRRREEQGRLLERLGRLAAMDAGPAAAPRPGAVFLGKYEVEREFGHGAFGTTWLAVHRDLGRRVVIKELRREWTDVREVEERFEREARLLAALDHPRVTRIYDVEPPRRPRYLVMEYAERGSLGDRLASGPLGPAEAARLTLQVLEGLAFIHAQGVVHRDLKPSNVLLAADGGAKIADFGVATGPDLARTVISATSSGRAGTPLFMAPEQVRGAPGDVRSDLFAVAVTFHQAVSGTWYLGRVPADVAAAERRILRGRPNLEGLEAPPALKRWLRRGLEPDPRRRFASAESMAEALRAALAAPAAPTRPARGG